MKCLEGEFMPAPHSYIPLSQRSVADLRARSDEMRQLAQSATTEDVKAVLLILANDFEELAAGREAQGNP